MNIKHKIADLVGNTPLLELHNYGTNHNCGGKIFAKLESFNPGGSVKDRLALGMIQEAMKSGKLKKGATIIEPTSGNTGIGLASIGTAMGFSVILVMPDTMSVERRGILKAYGAKLVLTDGSKGMKGSIAKAQELQKETKDAIILGQFVNPVNVQIHEETTGPEIWRDLDGQIDVFVAGVGTGGTISGVGSYLKKKNPNIQIVAVEPKDSAVLSGNPPGPHKIQGIGAGFVPEILKREVIDLVVTVEKEDAYEAVKALALEEGILVGISSGAALWVAQTIAQKDEYKNKHVVVLLPDTGERYLSTELFQ